MTYVSRTVRMALMLFYEAVNFNLPHKKKLHLLFSRNTIEINELLVFIDKLKVALNSNNTEAELKTIYAKKNNLCQPKSYVPFYFMDFLRTIFHFFAAEL